MEFPDLVPELKEFIAKLLGPTSEELGIWFGEKVRFLRFKSSIKVFNRAKEKLREAGFSEPKPVDLKTIIPLLEYCSLEREDSDLIEKWAGLLATACSLGLETYGYTHILNQLSPVEAKFLDMVYEFSMANISMEEMPIRGVTLNNFYEIFKITKPEALIYLDNLFRLGVCQPIGTAAMKVGDNQPLAVKTYEIFNITPLGVGFVKACRGPKKEYIHPFPTKYELHTSKC